MSKPLRFLAAVGFAALAGLPAANARAQAKPEPPSAPREKGVDQLDCRTLMRLSGEERGYTLLYLHGFVSGRKGQLKLATSDLAEATDRIVDHCIDHPADKLLAVFERFRGK